MQNNQEPHYQQWVRYFALITDDYCSFSFDLGLIRMLPLTDLGNLIQIAVKIKSPDEYGLPLEDEIETLDRMADELKDAYSSRFDVMPVGYAISNKMCNFYFPTAGFKTLAFRRNL